MSEKFTPTFFMRNRHLQTLFASFFRNTLRAKTTQERLYLDDGDFLDLNWHFIPKAKASTPIVILFHGLTGSIKSHYIGGMMHTLSQNGFNSVLMHFRSCSQEINNLPRSYHSGETQDALFCIHTIKKRFPEAELFGVGYSLGGNMLLKLLGELKQNTVLKAAVSVSAPMQLDICADVMKKGFSSFYQKYLMKGLKDALKKKYLEHDMYSLIGLEEKNIKTLKTFWDFDTIYTAPIHGFSSAQDYYTKSSSKQYLKYISTPTLIIHASDDPFMNDSILPKVDEISDSILLEVSSHGGHVGFIAGSCLQPKYWLEERIIDFFTKSI